jgi:hypothetical protein
VSTTRRSAIYGPEPWLTVGGAVWSHWDLWFCLAACLEHDGHLPALADAIADAHRCYGGSDAQRKLSHLDDLGSRLEVAALDASALATHAEDRPALRTKARTKVLRQGLYERDLTEAMRSTPRQRLQERALRGRWNRFPVSPQPAYERLVRALGEPWLPKGATFRCAGRIERARERIDRTADAAQRLAARRALVTYMYETMERCDDSYGVLGELATEALITYAKHPSADTGIDPRDWCEDLCELIVWDDYGVLMKHETAVFARVSGELADHAERFLLILADELRANRLGRQADDALQSIAYLHSAHGRLSRFAEAAATLGSDHWMPIVAMAEAALARNRIDVARTTFVAADRPGMQQEYLRKRCLELTGSPPTG